MARNRRARWARGLPSDDLGRSRAASSALLALSGSRSRDLGRAVRRAVGVPAEELTLLVALVFPAGVRAPVPAEVTSAAPAGGGEFCLTDEEIDRLIASLPAGAGGSGVRIIT